MSEAARSSQVRSRLIYRVRRTSLRTRLVLAFFTLIITSASATVFIADIVLGKAALSLATSKMDLALRMVELALHYQTDRLDLLASLYPKRAPPASSLSDPCDLPHVPEFPVDFAVLYRPRELALYRYRPTPAGKSASRDRVTDRSRCEMLARENFREVAGCSLVGLLRAVASRRKPYSGFMEADEKSMAWLVGRPARGAELLLVSAVPLDGEGALLLAKLADGKSDILSRPLVLSLAGRGEGFVVSIFRGNLRVADLTGKRNSGIPLDARLAESISGRRETYLGISYLEGRSFYAAYKPIMDFRDVAVGILGIEAPEAYYLKMKQQTVFLFAGLIALGMIFGFFISYLFSGLLVRPVAELARGMQRVAEGDLDFKVRVASTDELGKLAKAFNRMVTNIKERDLRLREVTSERLSQVEKQVSIGRLAAGVAHEINNPLTAVLSLSMLMLKDTKEGDPRREDLQVIVDETTRCRTIVRSLLDFAREVPSRNQHIDINQVIRDTVVLVTRYESAEDLEIALKLSDEPLLVDGDPEQLRQVFANVLINAAEACPEGGRVVVSTDEDSSGGFVIARIRDRGQGIPREYLDKVFQPFFTTKGASKGTGLGLSVSLGIVTKHGGSMEVESEVGRGTVVTILLPRVEQDAALQ